MLEGFYSPESEKLFGVYIYWNDNRELVKVTVVRHVNRIEDDPHYALYKWKDKRRVGLVTEYVRSLPPKHITAAKLITVKRQREETEEKKEFKKRGVEREEFEETRQKKRQRFDKNDSTLTLKKCRVEIRKRCRDENDESFANYKKQIKIIF